MSGYVLVEQFKAHTVYFVRPVACDAHAGAEMTSRVREARQWPTRAGARLAKHKYKLTRAKVVPVREALS